MAGLLDNKKRFIDTIVTDEGRRQMARGKINIRFATFTDQDVFYEGDVVSGTTDATQRPHMEAFSRPQDTITFESDDIGRLLQYKGSAHGVVAGQVLVTSGSKFLNFPPTADRRAAQLGLLTSSIDNFGQLYALSTTDPLLDTNEFRISSNQISFDVVDGMLAQAQGIDVTSIDDVESLFQDRRLSHAPNFKYLPPRNTSTPEEPNGSVLGAYPQLDQGNEFTYVQLKRVLEGTQKSIVRFSDTSRDNNIFGQLFDVRNNSVVKLDVIDFGEFVEPGVNGGSRHVFFAGRIFQDSHGSHTFVNLFTMIFS